MINFDDYDILKNNISTLKETSIDNHDKTNIRYMTYSEKEAINFDNVKREYIKKLSLSEEPRSNDALFINKNNALVFVEFKNGSIDPTKKFAIRKKIYDSVIILTDIMNIGVSKLRDSMEYILVYNAEVNKDEKDVLEKQKSFVQPSSAFDTIAKSISAMGKTEYVCFGVKSFENYCFHKVHTYTEAEFENYLKNAI